MENPVKRKQIYPFHKKIWRQTLTDVVLRPKRSYILRFFDQQVEVPFEFHRFIIGQKGAGVRQLMNDHDVNIKVPQSELKSSTIVVTGPPPNVEEARKALNERVKELELEKADREAKSYEIKVEIKPEYHPKIIGRKGAIITKLREDFDVNIQLPRKDSPDESTITITGYEKNATEARDAILKIVGDYVNNILLFYVPWDIQFREMIAPKSSLYLLW